jgi:hypothetical protein
LRALTRRLGARWLGFGPWLRRGGARRFPLLGRFTLRRGLALLRGFPLLLRRRGLCAALAALARDGRLGLRQPQPGEGLRADRHAGEGEGKKRTGHDGAGEKKVSGRHVHPYLRAT